MDSYERHACLLNDWTLIRILSYFICGLDFSLLI
jgi:hypothetical protein